jgi:SAM-dependent methyltransferase
MSSGAQSQRCRRAAIIGHSPDPLTQARHEVSLAVSFDFIRVLEGYGVFATGKSLLDIGTSNLYDVDAQELVAFFRRHGCRLSDAVENFAAQVALGSGRAPDGSARNESWLGQAVEAIGMTYDSVDVALGYKTRVVDLNRQSVQPDMRNAFDVVLNCGTTEHILNQLNAFRFIHDATKVDGLMIHQVPNTGHTDHGYFTYTSRFFFDLASYNKYDLLDFWIDGPDGFDRAFAGVHSYSSEFPILKDLAARIGEKPSEAKIDAMQIPNNSLNVVMRKRDNRGFVGMMELSTSWGTGGAHDADQSVIERYAH